KEIALSLFPNPAKDVVSVQYNLDATSAKLEVYDIAGRSISTNVLSSSVGDLQLNTSSYPSGVYIVVVKQDGVLLARKKLLIE
ncbi:T9SS type A sorting domain-containing protein, partial [Flavobacterium aquatile]